MCQMCDEYENELVRMGLIEDAKKYREERQREHSKVVAVGRPRADVLQLRGTEAQMDDKIIVEFDPDTMSQLTRQAEAHGRGVDEEVREIVRDSIVPPPPKADWVARARAIRAMTPRGSIVVDSWKLIRASRDWDH